MKINLSAKLLRNWLEGVDLLFGQKGLLLPTSVNSFVQRHENRVMMGKSGEMNLLGL